MDESTSDLYPRIEQSADMSHGTLAIDVETLFPLTILAGMISMTPLTSNWLQLRLAISLNLMAD